MSELSVLQAAELQAELAEVKERVADIEQRLAANEIAVAEVPALRARQLRTEKLVLELQGEMRAGLKVLDGNIKELAGKVGGVAVGNTMLAEKLDAVASALGTVAAAVERLQADGITDRTEMRAQVGQLVIAVNRLVPA